MAAIEAAAPPDAGPITSEPPPLTRGLLAVCGGVLGAHLLTSSLTPYGFQRDELLYMAMGRHLRLFAMDFPPFIAMLAEGSRVLLGESLFALRLWPALGHAVLVALAALAAREMGGRRGAQVLAGLSVALAPLYLRAGTLYQPVVWDQVWWSLALLALLRLGRPGLFPPAWSPRDWLLLGFAGGLGLLTKFSIGVIGVAALLATLLTPLRSAFRTRWPWLAATLALAIGAPSIIGQIALDFPVIGQMGDLREAQLSRVTYPQFVLEQVLMVGPIVLLGVAGAGWLIVRPDTPRRRAAGIAAAGAFLILMVLRGKPYYAGPIHPVMLGVGAALLERAARATAERGGRWRARGMVGLAWAAVVVYGVVGLPLGLPIIPPEPMARYATALGVTTATRTNTGVALELPQDYADMLGWEEQARAVAEVYHGLPDDERERAVILATNYGRAGAIDLYGPRHGLPPAIAPVGSYWYFGPGERPGDPTIIVGDTRERLLEFFASVELAGRAGHPWSVPEERDVPIWVAREPHRTLQEVWPLFEGQN